MSTDILVVDDEPDILETLAFSLGKRGYEVSTAADGLDGLAGGSALLGFGAFMIIGYWAFRNPDVYAEVVNPLDMGVFAAAFAGGCLGFLWWNAAPARIFMGDVGALAIGSATGGQVEYLVDVRVAAEQFGMPGIQV